MQLCWNSIFDVCCVRCGYRAGTESEKVFYVKTILERAFHHGPNPPDRSVLGTAESGLYDFASFASVLCTKYPTQTCSAGREVHCELCAGGIVNFYCGGAF